MVRFQFRSRRRWLLALAAVAALSLAALLLKPGIERAARTRIESGAARHGMVARIARVRVGLWPLLRLEDFTLEIRPGFRLHTDRIAATWFGRLRLAVDPSALSAPAGITINMPATAWALSGLRGGDSRLAMTQPQSGLVFAGSASPAGSTWTIEATQLELGRLLDPRRDGRQLLEAGIADGRVDLQSGDQRLHFQLALATRGARLGALTGGDAGEPLLGDPTDLRLQFDGDWQRSAATLEVPDIQASVAGALIKGSLNLRGIGTDPSLELALGVQRLDFAQLLGASGLEVPDNLGLAATSAHDLGSAAIDLAVRGRLDAPASLTVTQQIDFRPPRTIPPTIASLRGDFIFNAAEGAGPQRPVDVSPASPDFIALSEVPPLFIRTLLMAEDAGFYGHRGIDLRELPTALLADWSRGGAARGASTLSQQLAKNLFLSREKQLGRKLQELAITFLLESALGKERILEIYLNIIEWGPELRGLRPAAHAYFGREPQALTPAEMAFLVSIIPGPVKYQSSFAHGTPGPGLRALIDELLTKLRSVDAISAEEYGRALTQPIVVMTGNPGS